MDNETFVPRINEIERSLFSEYRWIGFLADRGKPYNHIIGGLMEIGRLWNSEEKDNEQGAFSMRWMAERLEEKPSKITKWIRLIYNDLLELNMDEPHLFAGPGEILCEFLFEGNYDSYYVAFGVPCIPRVGDKVDFQFLEAVIGLRMYVVREVTISREKGETHINVHCRIGTEYNLYREFIRSKATFMGELDLMTEWREKCFLDEMLMIYGEKGYMPSAEEIKRKRKEYFKGLSDD